MHISNRKHIPLCSPHSSNYKWKHTRCFRFSSLISTRNTFRCVLSSVTRIGQKHIPLCFSRVSKHRLQWKNLKHIPLCSPLFFPFTNGNTPAVSVFSFSSSPHETHSAMFFRVSQNCTKTHSAVFFRVSQNIVFRGQIFPLFLENFSF